MISDIEGCMGFKSRLLAAASISSYSTIRRMAKIRKRSNDKLSELCRIRRSTLTGDPVTRGLLSQAVILKRT